MKKKLLIITLLVFATSIFAQKLTTNNGHTYGIDHSCFSNSGKYILSASDDGSIKLWNTQTRQEVRSFIGHEEMIKGIEFLPGDMSFISASYDGVVKLWDIITGENIKTINYPHKIYLFALSPDRKVFAYIADGHILYVKSINDELIFKQRLLVEDTYCLSFSPICASDPEGGKYLLSGANLQYDNSKIFIWETNTGKLIHEIYDKKNRIGDVKFGYDGKTLIGCGGKTKNGETWIWNINTGKEIALIKTGYKKQFCVALSPDGRYCATSGGIQDDIYICDLINKKLITSLYGHEFDVKSLNFSNDGKYLLSSGWENFMVLWDAKSKYWRKVSIINGKTDAVNSVKFSPVTKNDVVGGKFLLSGQGDPFEFHGHMRLWCMQNHFENHTINSHKILIPCVDYSSDGSMIAGSGFDLTAVLLDTRTDKVLHDFKSEYSPDRGYSSVSFSPSTNKDPKGSKYLAVTCDDYNCKNVFIYDTYSGEKVKDIITENRNIRKAKFSLDGEKIASKGSLGVLISDFETGEEIVNIYKYNAVAKDFCFNNKGNIITAGSDSLVSIWDAESGRNLRNLKGHNGELNSVALSPDGNCIFSAGADKTIIQWDFETGNKIKEFNGHAATIQSLDVTPNGKLLASASMDGHIKIWEIETAEQIATMIALDDKNEYIIYTPDYYYTGTKGAFNDVYFVNGLDIYQFDQFDLQYNRPDIVYSRLGMSSNETFLAYKKAYEKRLRKMDFDPSNFEKTLSFNIPELDILDDIGLYETVDNQSFEFNINARDKKFKLSRLFVEVNGVPLYGVQGQLLSQKTKKITNRSIQVNLCKGKNKIKVSVMNKKGVESIAKSIEINYKPKQIVKPTLYVVSIGVSKYQNADYNLTYADKDANDFTELMKMNSKAFKEVKVFNFNNQNAKKEDILAIRSELEKSKVDDHVIVFIASHGLLDDDLDYYIAMHDCNFENPKNGGLNYNALEKLLDEIPARNKLMFIDACHSGEVDKEESMLVDADMENSEGVNYRGFKALKTNNSGIDLKSSFELMKELFADLRRNNGTVVISSAGGGEYAFESSEWKNGVFTYALLEGLKSENADADKNGEIMVSELRDYIFNRVKNLTNGKQNPTSRRENLEFDFRVW